MTVFGIAIEFLVFGATLMAIASLHRAALPAAVVGLAATVACKLVTLGLTGGLVWLSQLLVHEWSGLANLFLLLVGFAVLANQFEQSALPDAIPSLLPRNWTGGLVLLGVVFVLSIFLDNIAAAIIGGVLAKHVYGAKVGTGYLAAIVAAANAGGAGSVLGDTTTTMMWISGISPLEVATAFVASLGAFLVFAPLAALQQYRLSGAVESSGAMPTIEWARAAIALITLATIVAINAAGNVLVPGLLQTGPWLGLGLWAAILLTALWRRPDWGVVPDAAKGSLFLMALVAMAHMMPIHQLPEPAWQTASRSGDSVVGVRQHSSHGASAQAGRLRLGSAGLCCGVWRVDVVVRVVGWRSRFPTSTQSKFVRYEPGSGSGGFCR